MGHSGGDGGAQGAIARGIAMVLCGTLLEGVLVGAAQWLVLRGALRGISWQAWITATAAGAGAAWVLGVIPSVLMSQGQGGAPQPEMSDAAQLWLAALMGLLLGPILAVPQWLVLRRHLARAALWVPANAAAWSLGMVVVFAGMSRISFGGFALGVVLGVAASLAVAGAVVGAVHGAALVWLLRRRADGDA
jgi:hypothetical protein